MKRLLIVIALVGATLGLGGTAEAAQPTFERIDVDDSFVDEVTCGFPVLVVAEGHFAVRTFDNEDGLVEVFTINIGVTLSANGNEYMLRDVGSDVLRVTPDGFPIISIAGQVPFEYTGVLKLNVDTGEVILEPQHSTEDRNEICQLLGG